MKDPESSSRFCAVCSRTFDTPQGRAGHQSHSQDAGHRAYCEARKNRRQADAKQPTAAVEPVTVDKPVPRPTAPEPVVVEPAPRPRTTPIRPSPEPLALPAGEIRLLLPARVPTTVPRQARPEAPEPPTPKPALTAMDFFTALAHTPPRAGLARWEQWLLGIAILAGLALAVAWPLIQARKREHLAQQPQRVAPPTPAFTPPSPPRGTGFQWPPGVLVPGIVRPRGPRWA